MIPWAMPLTMFEPSDVAADRMAAPALEIELVTQDHNSPTVAMIDAPAPDTTLEIQSHAAANAPLPEYEAFDDDFDETLDLFAEVAEACETNGRSSDAVRARSLVVVVVVARVARLFSSRAR